MRRWSYAAVALACALLLPAAAMARPAYTSRQVVIWAGPGDNYPDVGFLPPRTPVHLYGCIRRPQQIWCDISGQGQRGFVLANSLSVLHNGNSIVVANAPSYINIPFISFDLGTYWGNHYRNRSFYGRRSHYERFWRENHGRYGYGGSYYGHERNGHYNGHHGYNGHHEHNGYYGYHGHHEHNGHAERYGHTGYQNGNEPRRHEQHGHRYGDHHHAGASNTVTRTTVKRHNANGNVTRTTVTRHNVNGNRNVVRRTVTTTATPNSNEQLRHHHHHHGQEHH